MTRVKASDIPASLLHAFVDALEGWGALEHELFMVWQLLSGSGARNFEKAWEEFSSLSTSDQRKQTLKLVKKFGPANPLPEVFDRLVDLTRLRDRIVHGRWHPIQLVIGGREAGVEYIRLYDARGEPSRPSTSHDEKPMLGRSRFYERELKDAERQFLDAARDISRAKADMIAARGKWIGRP